MDFDRAAHLRSECFVIVNDLLNTITYVNGIRELPRFVLCDNALVLQFPALIWVTTHLLIMFLIDCILVASHPKT